jgi:hypothetical protein
MIRYFIRRSNFAVIFIVLFLSLIMLDVVSAYRSLKKDKIGIRHSDEKHARVWIK